MPNPKLNQKSQAILLMLSSAFCFALMNVFVRLSGDLPSPQKAFFRNIVAIPFAAAVIFSEKERPNITMRNIPGLILRSTLGTVGILCNFYAVDHMLLADASILNRLSPFVTVLLSWIFMRERLDRVQGISIIIAFCGALCIIRPGFGSLTSFPALIATIGGICAGAAYTTVRWLTQHGVNKAFIVFFFSVFSCAALLPHLLLNYQSMTFVQFIILMLAGLAGAGGQFSITYAYSKAPSREISVFDYTIVIFAGILGYFIFDQMPDAMSFLGYFIICGVSAQQPLDNCQIGQD
jgi:drug/metabolite transporter (DMT)-like permease